MNLWPVEHFFEHICYHFWVGLLLHSVGWLLHPPKSDDKYAQKSVQLVRGSSFPSDLLQNPYFTSISENILLQCVFLGTKISSYLIVIQQKRNLILQIGIRPSYLDN